MPEAIGKLITCQRCNNTIFLKYTKSRHFDGGYTTVDDFEPLTEGWRQYIDPFKGHLCPKCNEEYSKMVDVFFGAIPTEVPERDSDWRTFEDEKPYPGEKILVCTKTKIVRAVTYLGVDLTANHILVNEQYMGATRLSRIYNNIPGVYWMPIPILPEGEEADDD